MTEANLFCTNQDDFTVHFKLTVPEAVGVGAESGIEELTALYKMTQGFLSALKRDGYKPDPSKGARKSGGNPNYKPQPKPMVNGVEIVCPACQGPVWDNRAENAKRVAAGQKARPQFACKDKEGCSWVEWDNAQPVQGAVNPSPVAPKRIGNHDAEFASLAETAEDAPFI